MSVRSAAAEALRRRLRTAGRRLALVDAAKGLVGALGAGTLAFALAAALEAALWLPPSSRVALVALVALAAAGPLLRAAPRPSPLPALARRVAARLDASAADRLLTAFGLAFAPAGAASPLREGALAALARDLDAVPLEAVATLAPARRAARWAWTGPLALALAFAAAPGPMRGASARLLSPLTAFARPAPFALEVSPGDVRLVAGDSLRLVATVEGAVRPAEVYAELQHADGAGETVRLVPNAFGAFTATLNDVRRPLRYRFVADPVQTDWYRVSVARRPVLERLRVTVAPPAYTGQAPTTLPPGVGDVTALRGARVALDVAVQADGLKEAYVVYETRRIPLAVQGGRVSGGFALDREGTYRIVVVSSDGLDNAAPVAYRVALLPDTPPEAFLAAPQAEAAFPPSGRLTLDVRATDDHGIAALTLFFRTSEAAPWQTRALPRPASRLDGAVLAPWTPPRPGAGGAVAYYVEARDALGQTGRSAVQHLRAGAALPPPEDPARAVAARQDSAEAAVQTLQSDAERARDAAREVREALRGGRLPRDGTLKALRERQAALREQADAAREQARSLRDELARQEASPEVQTAYRQLQETLEELLDPEMQAALEALQQALAEDRVDDAEAAAERYAEHEEALRDRLEQARRLMERMRAAQQLDAVAQRAEDLARQQQAAAEAAHELAEQQAPKPGETPAEQAAREAEAERRADEIAEAQRQSAEEAEQLEEDLRALEQRAQQTPGVPRQSVRDAREQLEAQDVPEAIQQSAEAAEQNAPEQAAQRAQQAAQALQRAQQQLRGAQQQMQQQQQEVDAAALRRALDDVVRLSQQQEALRQRTQRTAPDSPALSEAARQQAALERRMAGVADTLSRLAQRSPVASRMLQQHTGAARRQMREAAERLAARQPTSAVPEQRGAMEDLNELALRLGAMLQQGQSGQSGGGQSLQQMLQQMQQMSGEQQRLNGETQRMIDGQQGERLRPDGQSEARHMAERQQQLQRQLRDLGRNPETRGRMLDDLQTLARQMDAVAQELRRGRVTRELQEQQRQILSRLLEAQRALQQRGEERRREASPPGAPSGAPPSGLAPPVSPDEQRRRDLLRALDAPYSPEVEALIRRYFQRLGAPGGN